MGRSCAHTPDHSCTRTHTHTHNLSISSSRRVPPPHGEKGRYYIGGILVLARLGPRQFWEWSSKNSRGKSCLLPLSSCPLASSSSSSSSSSPSARRGIARSRGSPFAFSALAVPRSSSSLSSTAYRVTDVVHLAIFRGLRGFRGRELSDAISVREFAIFAVGSFPRDAALFLSLFRSSSLSLSLPYFFLCPEKKIRDTDRKPSPRHFCDYPRRSPRRASYNTHPLSRFRWRFTNSAYYPEPTRSTFF